MKSPLVTRIGNRSAKVGVVGLGYVGLPVACTLADAGFQVVGVDLKADRVQQIRQGVSPIVGKEPGLAELLGAVVSRGSLKATTDVRDLAGTEIVIVAVETPVNEDRSRTFDALRAALTAVAPLVARGALVIVESTIAPGTMNEVVAPLLERVSGLRRDVDFLLGHCPQRVMPGRLLRNIATMSRVCGGSSPEAARAMATLYRTIVIHGELDETDCVTAELVKTAENTFRDLTIAFANELALVCEQGGADFLRVRELVNKSPERAVPYAGAGVGGHCIPKDPWLLAYGSKGRAPALVQEARRVNEKMPMHMAALLEDALGEHGKHLSESRIAILGFSYSENTSDTRNSPSVSLASHLRERGAELAIHDSWVEAHRGNVMGKVAGTDAIVLMVAHDEYRSLDLASLRRSLRTPILIDGRFVFTPDEAAAAGFTFRGIGRGHLVEASTPGAVSRSVISEREVAL